MFYFSNTYILTSDGFRSVDDVLNSKNEYSIAYINNGNLEFTNNYSLDIVIPENVVKFNSDKYLSFITSPDTHFYTENTRAKFNLISTDFHNAKSIALSYKCFEETELNQKMTVDIDNNTIDITIQDFIKLLFMYICFGSKTLNKQDDCIRLYSKNSYDFSRVLGVLDRIGGQIKIYTTYTNHYSNETCFYIHSKLLFRLICAETQKSLSTFLFKNTHLANSSYTICKVLEDLCNELEYYDTSSQEAYVLVGNNLDKYKNYIIAYLVVNGYKISLNQLNGKRWKLLFVKEQFHKIIDNSEKYKNTRKMQYYNLKMCDSFPVFIMETRNYITTVSLRSTDNSYNILGG